MEAQNYYTQPIGELLSVGRANGATLTKMHFIDLLYDRLGLSRIEAGRVVEAVFQEIEQALIDGREVKLANFGTFSTRDKVARPGRNPKTGQAHVITARRVVTFVPAPHLRESVAAFKDDSYVEAEDTSAEA